MDERHGGNETGAHVYSVCKCAAVVRGRDTGKWVYALVTDPAVF